MMTRFPTRILVGSALLAALTLGCKNPYIVQTMERDRQSIRFVLDSIAAREAAGADRLRSTFEIMNRQWKKDAEDTPENIRGVGAFFRKDVEDWPRHEKDIRNEIRRQTEGDIDTILWTLPRLVF